MVVDGGTVAATFSVFLSPSVLIDPVGWASSGISVAVLLIIFSCNISCVSVPLGSNKNDAMSVVNFYESIFLSVYYCYNVIILMTSQRILKQNNFFFSILMSWRAGLVFFQIHGLFFINFSYDWSRQWQHRGTTFLLVESMLMAMNKWLT